MRHYVAQFYTTQTYHLILEGHVYFFTRIRFETPFQDLSGMGISNLLSCHNNSIVPPRLDPFVGEFRVTPILRRLDVLGQNRIA